MLKWKRNTNNASYRTQQVISSINTIRNPLTDTLEYEPEEEYYETSYSQPEELNEDKIQQFHGCIGPPLNRQGAK